MKYVIDDQGFERKSISELQICLWKLEEAAGLLSDIRFRERTGMFDERLELINQIYDTIQTDLDKI